MRQFISLALSLGVVASAAAQTQGEVIIRRPGVPDRVIRLDSGAVKEQIAKLENQLRELTVTTQLRNSELPARVRELQNKVQLNVDGLRSKTLALRERDVAGENFIAPLMRTLENNVRRRPIIGIQIAVEPRETDKVGAYINAVTPGSPAEKAGILAGDIIIRIGGKSVLEKDPKAAKDATGDFNPGMRLIEIISNLAAGKPVDVELRRGTKNVNLKVTPIEENSTSAIARMAPSIAEIQRVPGERIAGDQPLFRGTLSAPAVDMFANGSAAFGAGFAYAFDNNDLFARLELTSLNEKLGAYFGTNEGVLVVNVGAPKDVVFAKILPSTAGRGGVMIRTDSAMRKAQFDSAARRAQGAAAGGRGGAGAIGAPNEATPRVSIRGGRVDSAVTYIDGVPVQPGVRRPPVNIPLEPGDVIVSVDGRKVTNPSQLMRIVRSYEHNDEFKLQIIRQKRSETLTIKMP